ncbi:MAG: ABC transporter ATP-binding protein [Dehalococcoidales bacterium]|jgi:ATP-binding cassette subfamily B protein
MLKLIKHLKPFTWLIVAIFVLLFGQAMADLSLPGYLADITNVGISQQGIENSVPQAIRQSEFNRLTIFMSTEGKSRVTDDYILLDKNTLSSGNYAEYVKTYPYLANEPVYKLNTVNKDEITQLDAFFRKAIPVVATIEAGGTDIFAGSGIQIPPGADPLTIIAKLPPDQFARVLSVITQQTASLSDTMLKQYSTVYISGEYKALGMNINDIQTAYMLRIGLLMLLLTLASAAASIAVGYLSAGIAAGLGRNLRRQQFIKVSNFSNTELDRFSTASLITRSTNDVTQIQLVMVMMFRFLFYAPILGIGGIIKVLGTDSSMLWIIGAAVGTMMALIIVMFTIALPKFTLLQKLVDKVNLVTREMLTGLMVIRAFNRQKYQEEKFDGANTELTKTNLFVNRVMVLMMPVMMLIMNGAMILIIWVGSHQVNAGFIQVGDMMAFMQYAVQIIMAFLMVSIMFIMVPRASVSARRISEVLETEPVIKEPKVRQKYSEEFKGVVEFDDVSFRYPSAEDDVLKNITFTARPGHTTAFIGSTGSGKSTLINLIPRFYDVTAGKVLVGGQDVRDVSQHDLRGKIGYVPQKAVLFSGTIASNIKYANENATDDEVARYAKTAQALDFIDTSEQGYATAISQGGANLSGGQKQRLSISRALAKKPEIYVFDDSLSALDFKTDAALRRALKKETADATVLIVTQRVSTIMGSEQIVVLDEGRVCGIGTHNELMQKCEVYREIALSQLSREELNR